MMRHGVVTPRLVFLVQLGLTRSARAFGVGVGVLATGFGLAQAGGVTLELIQVLACVGGTAAVSLAYGFARRPAQHLPDTLAACDERDTHYTLKYETPEVCAYFNKAAAKFFGRDSIEDSIVETWRSKSPSSFVYLENASGLPCAAACIFGLNDSFLAEFVRGRLCELDIEQDDVFDLATSKRARALYLAAFMVEDPHTQLGHRRATAMVWALVQYIKKLYGTRKRRVIYAVPINTVSKNLVARLGFRLVSPGSARKDGHDLWGFEVCAENLSHVLERTGSFAPCCTLRLERANIAGRRNRPMNGRRGGRTGASGTEPR